MFKSLAKSTKKRDNLKVFSNFLRNLLKKTLRHTIVMRLLIKLTVCQNLNLFFSLL